MDTRGPTVALCALAIALCAAASAAPAPAATQPAAAATAPRSVPQGAAVRLAALRSDRRYRDTFLRAFDSLTPENEMKMQALQPRRGSYRFDAADELVRFAERNGVTVRGHALVWGQGLPLWIFDHGVTDKLGLKLPPLRFPGRLDRVLGSAATFLTGWRRDELLAVMKDHIRTVMRHYGDRVLEWDVVNEPLTAVGTRDANVWQRYVGADYIEQALRTARTANPRARLFINEYSVEYPGAKLEGLYRLARDLRARGVPLDGIGLQTHTHIAGFNDEATLTDTMRRFEALGLEVQITEMDVGTSVLDLALPQRLERQALAYRAAARACAAVRACTSFTTWGFTDAFSWLGFGESALLFDRDYRPKPAFEAVRAALARGAARTAAARAPAAGRARGGVPAASTRRRRGRARAGARGSKPRRAAAAAPGRS